jgi:hypothetical protein
MYINPIYEKSLEKNSQIFSNQHPYASEKIGEPYACSYNQNNLNSLLVCIDKALKTNLKPYIPIDFTKENYKKRVIKIFDL